MSLLSAKFELPSAPTPVRRALTLLPNVFPQPRRALPPGENVVTQAQQLVPRDESAVTQAEELLTQLGDRFPPGSRNSGGGAAGARGAAPVCRLVYANQMLQAPAQPVFSIRPAQAGDEQALFALVQALADYEKLSHAVTGSAEKLAEDLFGARPAAEALLVELNADVRPVAFALFFHNYSTFLTQPGLYLEDIFVLPEHRRHGIGKALLREVAKIARARKCGRLEWSVLDWNVSAIGFYQSLGASVLPDWRICRVTGDGLDALAHAVPSPVRA
jgi:GNAT superfamily N-acetyltransferase